VQNQPPRPGQALLVCLLHGLPDSRLPDLASGPPGSQRRSLFHGPLLWPLVLPAAAGLAAFWRRAEGVAPFHYLAGYRNGPVGAWPAHGGRPDASAGIDRSAGRVRLAACEGGCRAWSSVPP